MHKPLMTTNDNDSKIERLERFFEIYKLGCISLPHKAPQILKLSDHKGCLHVLWDNLPFSEEAALVKIAWEMQNEYEVIHLISNEQVL